MTSGCCELHGTELSASQRAGNGSKTREGENGESSSGSSVHFFFLFFLDHLCVVLRLQASVISNWVLQPSIQINVTH